MRFPYYLGTLAPLLMTVVSEQLVIPEVDRVVGSIVSVAYSKLDATRPTGNITAPAPKPTAVTAPHINSAEATTYWYEEITHQGISAFGSSSYVVYRNVKDYGAKGNLFSKTLSNSCL
jgi:glucan 1,3-beta-glucosidase